MNDDDREFVREMMEESKNGPPLKRVLDWLVGKTFWMPDGLFAVFLAAINVLGIATFVALGFVASCFIRQALCS